MERERVRRVREKEVARENERCKDVYCKHPVKTIYLYPVQCHFLVTPLLATKTRLPVSMLSAQTYAHSLSLYEC